MCAREFAVRKSDAVYVRVYQDWTPRAMLARICQDLNGMNPGSVALAKSVIVEELDSRPRVILMDEADRLSNANIEHLRDIHDETGSPIILIGEPSLYGRLKARRRVWERVTRVVEFGPVTDEDVVVFGVKACDLKIAAPAAQYLVKRCQGSFRLLYHLMIDTERSARANNTKEVSLELVQALPDRRKAPTPEKEPR
jgi:DNA transposition AAA+ family ATPase